MLTTYRVVVVCIHVTSLCTCMGFVFKLRRLSGASHDVLFSKLLRSLACADIVFHMFCIAHFVLGAFDVLAGGNKCQIMIALIGVPQTASFLHVVTIAAFCMAVGLRSSAMLKCIHRLLMVLWPLGCIIGPVGELTGDWEFEQEARYCVPHGRRYFFDAVLVFCGSVSLLAYMALALQAWYFQPGSVQRQQNLRVAIYPFNFLLTWGLLLASLYFPALWGSEFFFTVEGSAEGLGGLLNVCTYAWQARYQNKSEVGGLGLGSQSSPFRVYFGPTDFVYCERIVRDLSTDQIIRDNITDQFMQDVPTDQITQVLSSDEVTRELPTDEVTRDQSTYDISRVSSFEQQDCVR